MIGSRSRRSDLRAEARWWQRTFAGQRHSKGLHGPRRRRFQRGQSLVIFALSATVLVGMTGLAIDVLRAYDMYGREHRAAEAAALAGVLYMPNFYNVQYTSSSGSTDSAITRALAVAHRDGFGDGTTAPTNCTAPNTSTEVTVCKADPSLNLPPNTSLQVTISERIDIFFLSMVGVQSFNVTSTSVANYLPGLNLGTPNPNDNHSYYWSDGGECNNKPSPPPSCSGGLHAFSAAINGPAALKEAGDPFVNCEEGPSYTTTPDISRNSPPASLYTNPATGFVTNHPQYSQSNMSQYKCGTANPDQQPVGYTGSQTGGTSHPGAYNFYVQASNPANKVSIWVFNPAYGPTDPSSCNGIQLPDQFFQNLGCTTYYSQYNSPSVAGTFPSGIPQTSSNFEDARLYFNVTYTSYKVTTLYDRGGDVADTSPNACNGNPANPDNGITGCPIQPFDDMSWDKSANGCGGGQVVQLPTAAPPGLAHTGTCVSASSVHQYDWVKVVDNIGVDTNDSQGIHRLAVEATSYDPYNSGVCGMFGCGWGVHAYGIKLCPAGYNFSSGVDNCPTVPGAVILPWNNMCMILTFNNSNFTNQIPLAHFPPSFAGRTITVGVFDPGDSHGVQGSTYVQLLPPSTDDNGNPLPTPITLGPSNYPAWEQPREVPFPGSPGNGLSSIQASANSGGGAPSDDIYNGLWMTINVTLPPDFPGGQFMLNIHHQQGKGFDELAVSIDLNGGSPVHIIF